jgi:hypothetical protein
LNLFTIKVRKVSLYSIFRGALIGNLIILKYPIRGMKKRDRMKLFFKNNVAFLKNSIASQKGTILKRMASAGLVYVISNFCAPETALAFNQTEVLFNQTEVLFNQTEVLFNQTEVLFNQTEVLGLFTDIHTVGVRCLPIPVTYLDGLICLGILGACGAMIAMGGINYPVDAACFALIKASSERRGT